MTRQCISHHLACGCREALFAEAVEVLNELITACDRCETRDSASFAEEFTAEMEQRARDLLWKIGDPQ